jgi:hypothetical protein
MAVASEAAEGVEKLSRRAKRTSTRDVVSGMPPGEPHAGRLRWVALAFLLAAAVAAGLFIVLERSWASRDGASDAGVDRRWKSLLDSDAKPPAAKSSYTQSPCYAHLVSPPRPGRCVHSAKRPLPTRMYDWVKAHVAVYTTAAAPHPHTALRDLGDAAQAKAIDLLGKGKDLRDGAWADIQGALNEPEGGAGERDPFTFDRVLIANVAKGVDWMPGDRMQWTRVLVQPINFQFGGYSVPDTDNETQKVSSIEATASRKVSPGITATIPGVEGPKLSLEATSERDLKASSDISAQYEKLGIDITRSFLRIMREGERGVDVIGNTRVPLTLTTDPKMIWKQFPGDEKAAESHAEDEPIVLLVTHFEGDAVDKQPIEILPQAPVPHCPLLARVWMIYEERRIEGERGNYNEGLQDVTLRRDAEDKQDVELLNADDVSPAVWSLKLCEDAHCTGPDPYVLEARLATQDGTRNTSPWRKVVFRDYGVAIRVAHWLRLKHTNTPPNSEYEFNYPFYSDYPHDEGRRYVTMAPVKATDNNCAPKLADPLSRRAR